MSVCLDTRHYGFDNEAQTKRTEQIDRCLFSKVKVGRKRLEVLQRHHMVVWVVGQALGTAVSASRITEGEHETG